MIQKIQFRTRNWVEIHHKPQGAYNNNENNSNYIKFKTSMIRTNLCDHSDEYILIKGTITVPNIAAQVATSNNTN